MEVRCFALFLDDELLMAKFFAEDLLHEAEVLDFIAHFNYYGG